MVEKKQAKVRVPQALPEPDYVDFTYIDQPAEERRKLDVGNIFLNQGKALCCGWIIRSKNRHHMARCKCGKSFIDGGSWYIRTGGEVELHTVNYTEAHTDEED